MARSSRGKKKPSKGGNAMLKSINSKLLRIEKKIGIKFKKRKTGSGLPMYRGTDTMD